ncbi:Cytochrome P450 76AD1 [Euphorbia peplus]|nr:Cytochrome P450 76AD1 [Euphorbia peplus]
MDLLIIISLLSAFTLFAALHFLARSPSSSRLPPGPTPIPVIGNLLQLGNKPHKSLAKLANIHGPIMTLKFGQIKTIVISSATLAKETLQTHDVNLSDRTVPDAVRAQNHHLAMEWLPVGAEWRKLRKICSSYIFSSQKLDLKKDLHRNKIQQLIADVEESCRKSEAVNIGEAAFRTMINTLSCTIFSIDLADSRSEIAREFKEVFRMILGETGYPNLSDYFPVLRMIDPQGMRRRMDVCFGRLLGIFDHMIDERVQKRKQPGYIPADDVLDILLNLDDEGNSSSGEMLDRESMKHLFMVS